MKDAEKKKVSLFLEPENMASRIESFFPISAATPATEFKH
jgi:hypothetical protein